MTRFTRAPAWTIASAIVVVGCDASARCAPGTREEAGACVAIASDAGAPDATVDAGPPPLPSDVHEIDGIGREGTAASYAAIDRVVGDATYVGLGETVHTVGGYYRAKQRVIRHLVEELGFRAIALESPWDAADALARYVDTCEGDPAEIVASSVFGVWASEELADVFRWTCEWNVAHPDDRVVFYGFDHQQPWDDGRGLSEILERIAGDDADSLESGYATCQCARVGSAASCNTSAPITREDHTACIAGLDAVDAWLTAHEAEIAASAPTDLEYARIRAIGLRGWQLQMYHWTGGASPEPDVVRSFEGRDIGMAYILQRMRVLRSPGARVIVWAHNTHLALRQERIAGWYSGVRSMGGFLRDAVGDEYVPIALAANQVDINWPGVTTPQQPGERSIEQALHRFQRPYLFVDLGPTSGERAIDPDAEMGLGGDVLIPSEQFAGVFFLEHAEAMHALLW